MVDFASLGVFISIVGSTIAGLIHTIQNSRCTKINACCISCDRDVIDTPIEEATHLSGGNPPPQPLSAI